MTILIGLTGGIATGKTTVAQIIRQAGISVVDADKIAAQVEGPNTPTLKRIVAEFGPNMQLPNGALNRQALGQLVFQEPKQLARLTAITEIPIQYAIFSALVQASQNATLVVLDVPLLFEGGWQNICDGTVAVSVSSVQQLVRLRQRNHLTVAAAQERIKAQLPLSAKIKRADWVIDNSGTIEETKAAVLQWLATYNN